MERLFQYCVLLRPEVITGQPTEKTVVIVPPSQFILAKSEREVAMLAAREIPKQYFDMSDRLEVTVRPF